MRYIALVFAATWLAALAIVLAAEAPTAATAPAYRSVLVKGIPHIGQRPDFCGEACAAMYLRKLGLAADQDYVFDQSGLDPRLGRGCHTRELVTALQAIGLRTGPVWYKVAADRAEEGMAALFQALHADLEAGIPSIVCMRYDAEPDTTEHFRLVLGYDAKTDEIVYHEPADAGGAYRRMARSDFLSLWPLKYDPRQWTVIRLRLEPGEIKPASASATFTAADYAQHFRALNKKIPAGFASVIQHPFVVIGDESPEMVKSRAEGTVKWAVDRLKAVYFAKDPQEILDIWLFKDKESYDKHTRSIFGEAPDTPFGYYSHAHGALVMNIATGGGTLVHEIVHPFIAANFPDCPAWFNEGLASLYEQCGDRQGAIWGATNWRLAGLQRTIRAGELPSFKDLCSTTQYEFYELDRGDNYAQARYLCYWLQEHGLLAKYYHAFRTAAGEDPGGYRTLQKTLGRDDMLAFQRDWEAWVLKLRFP